MKPPITYYGGKQRMARQIVSMLPDHSLYCEPFLGGGAVFWQKEPSKAEVLNDLDERIVNFYQVLQTNFDELFELVEQTLHSRSQHTAAKYVLKREPEKVGKTYTYTVGPESSLSDPVKEAWAFWVQTNMSFSGKLMGGFAYCRGHSTTKAVINKKKRFKRHYQERLENVCLECNNAIKVISSRDTANSLFYCDPPYFNSDCGHYGGYSQDDFEELLYTLGDIKGRFVLSSYPSDVLAKYVDRHGWQQSQQSSAVSVSSKTNKSKTEVLTWNF